MPTATRNQLRPLVERALRDAKRPDARVLLVQADPAVLPEVGAVDGVAVVARGASSPIAVRRLLHAQGDEFLVVITDCDQATLGDDVLARAYGNRVESVKPWDTVRSLFGVPDLAAELVARGHLADALIDSAPLDGYPQLTARVLDLDTATATLVRVALDIDDGVDDLAGFLRWLDRPEGFERIAASRRSFLADLRPALVDRFGSGVLAALAAVEADRARDLVPLALAAGVIHGGGPPDDVAAARLDEWLARPRLAHEDYVRWSGAAEELVHRDAGAASAWVERAQRLLDDLDATALAHRSDVLPAGFGQRIAEAARALTHWQAHDEPAASATASAALKTVRSHRLHHTAPHRAERLEMAARLIRRRSLALSTGSSFAEAVQGYEADGAWLDAARLSVSRGDPEPLVAALLADLTARADAQRRADGERFALLATEAARELPEELIGVEQVLASVVAPLADVRPVLLLVLDGLSWATFTEVAGDLEQRGWSPWRNGGRGGVAPLTAVAALPTVTEVSRTSLLAGTIRRGDQGSEGRAFAGHPLLTAVTPDGAPVLFHKRDLRAGGLDTLPGEALSAIADEGRRVVGVVLNNIDERLKDVAQPMDRWDVRDLDPMAALLDEARRAGRAVVITADHGHVLDRDAEGRAAAGGGERWRPADPPAGPGEVLVDGPRVVTDGHRAILPTVEQLRYGPRRNGYHGGITPRELLVPLVVLSVDELPQSLGWVPTGFRRPSWWHDGPVLTATPPPTRALEPVAQPSLFGDAPALAPEPAAAGPISTPATAWIDALLATERIAVQRANPRVRIGDDELRRLLAVLDLTGTMAIAEGRLAEEASLPVARIGRYVAQLQDLLNLDGFGVVTVTDGEVRFDRALLDRQFDR